MSQAQEQLSVILPSLFPKLFRSSYDPNPKISSAMNNIIKVNIEKNQIKIKYLKIKIK